MDEPRYTLLPKKEIDTSLYQEVDAIPKEEFYLKHILNLEKRLSDLESRFKAIESSVVGKW